MDYLPFGGERSHDGQAIETSYKYTNQELDDTTGLYNYGARLYEPIIGRFISPDTIVQDPYDPETLNRYAYCRNNPLIYVDPMGYGFFDSVVDIFGLAGRS
jgi:RHS repeat-associated protein